MTAPAGPERLVGMANQIAKFFASQPGGMAAVEIADHLRAFWEPGMRREIIGWLDQGGAGLHPAAAEAVALLRTTGPGELRAALAAAGETTARAPGDDAG